MMIKNDIFEEIINPDMDNFFNHQKDKNDQDTSIIHNCIVFNEVYSILIRRKYIKYVNEYLIQIEKDKIDRLTLYKNFCKNNRLDIQNDNISLINVHCRELKNIMDTIDTDLYPIVFKNNRNKKINLILDGSK